MADEMYFTPAQARLIEALRNGYPIKRNTRKEVPILEIRTELGNRRVDPRTVESLVKHNIIEFRQPADFQLTELGRTVEIRTKL